MYPDEDGHKLSPFAMKGKHLGPSNIQGSTTNFKTKNKFYPSQPEIIDLEPARSNPMVLYLRLSPDL